MATRVVLVRHGVTDWNEEGRLLGRSETPLNERGFAQARAAGEALRALRPGEILTSPQKRTLQTAEAIATACECPLRADERLAEVWLRGWQGKTFADLHGDPDVHAYLRDPHHRSDEIEPIATVRERITALIDELRAEPRDAPVVLVSHGDPLRILVAELLGLPFGSFRSFAIDNGSISVARLGRKRSLVQLLNWLPGEPPLRSS